MNDLIPGAVVEGRVLYHGRDLYGPGRRPRRGAPPCRHGLSEAQSISKSIYENIAGRADLLSGYKGNMDQLVEESLCGVALWEEVKDKLTSKAATRSPAASSSASASRCHSGHARTSS